MNFLPIQINEAQLEALSITDGQLIFVKDKPAIYLDAGETRYSILLKATESTAGIVQPDNDTIKINDGVISADVVGNWVAGNAYPVGYFVSYNNAWYQCVTANSDTEWTAANWTLVADVAQYSAYLQAFMSSAANMMGATIAPNGSTTTSNDTGVLMTKGGLNSSNFIMDVLGSGANNHGLTITSDSSQGYHIANILIDIIAPWESAKTYKVNYYVTYENKLYQCITEHTSGDTFDKTYWSLIGGSGGGTLSIWEANTDYVIGSIIVNETTIYQCNTEHTSGDTFDSTYWTSMTGEKGEKGDTGEAPTITLESFENTGINGAVVTGVYIYINNPDGTVDKSTIYNGVDGINGVTPHIDETTKNWFLGETNTGILAQGTNGITPHIDENTKHWMIGDVDTGVAAEGVTTIATQKLDISTTLLAEGWSTTVPYEQTVQISEINATLNPRIDIIISDNIVTGQKEEISFSYLTKVVTGDGFITAYCYEKKPTVDLNILIEVI